MSETNSANGCPFLGILADPETRIGEADSLNHCFKQEPAQPVEISHQNKFCLTGDYTKCEIYRAADEKLAKEQEKSADLTSSIVGSALVGSQEMGSNVQSNQEEHVEQVMKEQEEKELPQNNDADWKKKLHEEAKMKYEEKPPSNGRKWIWGFLLVFSLGLLLAFAWAASNKYKNISAQAQMPNNGASQETLATQVGEMNVAVSALATIDSALEFGYQAEATREAATATAAALKVQEVMALTETPTDNLIVACAELDEIEYEIIEGPVLSPEPGFYYVLGSSPPEIQASWLVENTGNCLWESIAILSLYDGSITTPILFQDGQELDLESSDGKISVLPGEQIEIILPYDVTKARNVDAEYIVIVNGISLDNRSHVIIQVSGWVITIKQQSTSPTSENKESPVPKPKNTPTPKPKPKPTATKAEPPPRPTPTPPR